jgi:hypothetical protein
MNAPARTPTVGDNRVPLITADQLAKDFAHIEAFVAELEAKAKEAPPHLEDDDDLAIVNALVPKLRAGAKRCDEVREAEKRPYLDAGTTVQTFFKAFETRLLTLKTSLEARGTRYLDKKRAAEQRRREEIERKARAEAEQTRLAAIEAARQAETVKEHAASESNVHAHPALVQHAQATITAAAEAQARADDAAAASRAKSAELARTHTVGGTATLLDGIEPVVADYLRVDLAAIQVFIKPEEIMGALRAYARRYKDEIKAGTAKIEGVTFVLTTKGSFR